MKRVFLFAVFSAGLIAQDNQVQYLNLNKPHYTIGNKVRVRVEALCDRFPIYPEL